VYKELDKCQLLCDKCHKKKTIAEYKMGILKNPSFTHGTVYGYANKGCRCLACFTENEIFKKRKNEKRRHPKPILEVPHGSVLS
ncbi:hypothetical protein, partial [Loigolactobacillus coryniformis]|uniref:hypothetical protein n=1 Tax=Loigolactobacillus coryniformis TaxID=1610 RepID=UPI00201B154A